MRLASSWDCFHFLALYLFYSIRPPILPPLVNRHLNSGLWYFVYLVSLGNIKAPEGMEEGWTDPYPLPLRVLALVKWTLLVLFQVCRYHIICIRVVLGYPAVSHPCGAFKFDSLLLCLAVGVAFFFGASPPPPRVS